METIYIFLKITLLTRKVQSLNFIYRPIIKIKI